MKTNLHSIARAFKLSLLTGLIALFGFVYSAQDTQSYSNLDETPQFMLAEMQELLEDINSSTGHDFPGLVPSRLTLHLSVSFARSGKPQHAVVPSLACLYQVRPRSPPLHHLA